MKDQKGIIHLFALLIIILVLALAGFAVMKFGFIKIPSLNIVQKKSLVELKTEYKNPFNKNTQYVNPFDQYKNPLVVNR